MKGFSSIDINSFKLLAKKHSADEKTKKIGGDLGWVDLSIFPIPEFNDVLNSIDINDYKKLARLLIKLNIEFNNSKNEYFNRKHLKLHQNYLKNQKMKLNKILNNLLNK